MPHQTVPTKFDSVATAKVSDLVGILPIELSVGRLGGLRLHVIFSRNAVDPGKRDRIYEMVKSMKEEGVPIDGIGMQGHYNVYGPSMEDVDAALTKYSTIS